MSDIRITIGWKEWCGFPQLALAAIKAKIDTGATTSALHAFDIAPYDADGISYVRFSINPLRGRREFIRQCSAPLVDKRVIIDSGGHAEERYVIHTPLMLGEQRWDIELTLTNRQQMRYRMLLGRRAMQHHCIIDPASAYMQGRMSNREAYELYR